MKCNMCGAESEGAICRYCGNNNLGAQNITVNINNIQNNSPRPQAPPAQGMKNKWIAFILCLFFGVFGVHKFYEGKVGMGILYLFTGGLFCIGIFVDLIILLTKPEYYKP